MINTHSQTIEGQLAVGRSLSVGGEHIVQGGATISHDLMVKGRVIARDIQGNNKGLFSSVETLEAAYKKPLPGWYAYVEQAEDDPKIYIVVNGEWRDSDRTGMLDYVDLADYKQRLTRMETQFTQDVDDLDRAITAEATARETADSQIRTTVTAAIEQETTDRETAISAEQTARQQADTDLDERLVQEISDRGQADLQLANSLGSAISQETQDRQEDVRVINEAITDIAKALWPLDVTIDTNFTLAEYTGELVSLSMTRRILRREALVPQEEIESVSTYITEGENSLVWDQTTYPEKTCQRGITSYGKHRITIMVRAYGMDVRVDKDIRLELPIYIGFSEAEDVDSLDITSLVKQPVKTSPSGTYTVNNPAEGYHLWICIPKIMDIDKITSSGFDVPLLEADESQTELGEYKCYRTASESGINQGTIKISIS